MKVQPTLASRPSTSTPATTSPLMTDLFDAIIRNDLTKVQDVCKQVKDSNQKLTDKALRDPKHETTALHLALHRARWDIANT